MAIHLGSILLGILADRLLRRQIRKWLDVKSFDTEVKRLVFKVIEAKKDGKITKEEERELWKHIGKTGLAFLLDKIK